MAENIMSIDAIAKQLALELDKKDGTPDGKIDKKAWNDVFNAKEKGGKEIKSYISVFNAEKSIKSYLMKQASSDNERKDIGSKWLDAAQAPVQEEKATEEADSSTINIPELPQYDITNMTEPAFSTYVYRSMPEIIVTGDASIATKKAQKAFAQLTEYTTKVREIESLIKQEINKKGLNEKRVDIPYWTEKIARVSSRFSIPQEIIVSIISKETCFGKNISNKYGKGAMALTGIAIRSFFPNGQGNWNDIYQQLDNDLLQDILYKKDANGNLITDSNGKPVLKYKSSQELLLACGKDDELSMKVGSLIFEMKYAEAVAKQKYGRATYANTPKVIQQLKSGEIQLTENENITCVGLAVKNYNGCDTIIKRNGRYVAIKDDYKKDVMDSLKVQGYNFAEQNIIKCS